MERLTERYKEMVYYARCYDGTCNDYCHNETLKCEEDAIKRLAEYEDTEITPEQILQLDKLYSEKCRELAEYKRRLQKEWIPCSERLPDNYTNVIACFATGTVTELRYIGGGVFSGIYEYNTEVITAWQPLPEPFKLSKE